MSDVTFLSLPRGIPRSLRTWTKVRPGRYQNQGPEKPVSHSSQVMEGSVVDKGNRTPFPRYETGLLGDPEVVPGRCVSGVSDSGP